MTASLLLVLASFSCPVLATTPPTASASVTHDKAFWQSIIGNDYLPKDGASVPMLALELSSMLASRDPDVRDGTAYAILTSWIYQKRLIDGTLLRQLMHDWMTNLTVGIGSSGTDAVLLRSFSALMLSVAVARDNADSFLEADELRNLLDATLTYLRNEKDLRGYDPQLGWLHSAAHTADLLKFISRSRHLTREDQSRILDAISAKLDGAGVVFNNGEDERFARAVLSIVNRADFDRAAFEGWVTRTTPPPLAARPDAGRLLARQNVKNLFAKLYVLLSTAPQQTGTVRAARDALALPLKTMF